MPEPVTPVLEVATPEFFLEFCDDFLAKEFPDCWIEEFKQTYSALSKEDLDERVRSLICCGDTADFLYSWWPQSFEPVSDEQWKIFAARGIEYISSRLKSS